MAKTLQVPSSVSTTPQYVQDQDAVNSVLAIGTTKVGIGTDGPGTALEIKRDAAGGSPWTGQVLIQPLSNDKEGAISLKTTYSGSDHVWTLMAGMNASPYTNFRIYDSTAGADRINIDSNGYVGIGTTTPSKRLEIASGTKKFIFDVDDDHPRLTMNGGSPVISFDSTATLYFGEDAYTSCFYSFRGGNVGIGVEYASVKLEIDGAIGIKDGVTAPTTLAGRAFIYVDSADGDLKVKFGDGTVKTIVTD